MDFEMSQSHSHQRASSDFPEVESLFDFSPAMLRIITLQSSTPWKRVHASAAAWRDLTDRLYEFSHTKATEAAKNQQDSLLAELEQHRQVYSEATEQSVAQDVDMINYLKRLDHRTQTIENAICPEQDNQSLENVDIVMEDSIQSLPSPFGDGAETLCLTGLVFGILKMVYMTRTGGPVQGHEDSESAEGHLAVFSR
ncbi:hypothetical protein ARMGADRAFT_1037771 [Armillaria gallica]|uniref:Uncharacterized protein n=1 Tax=Armillaria gallica TaxID=47427 RepID=A0A2H3CP12_ARMGA|nr:hypothetical protein ARMGADRAFT_1037771 [Armillaria gallica]